MTTKPNVVEKKMLNISAEQKPKKYTLQNIHTFDKITKPSTPTKMEFSSSSTKSKSKGLTQK